MKTDREKLFFPFYLVIDQQDDDKVCGGIQYSYFLKSLAHSRITES